MTETQPSQTSVDSLFPGTAAPTFYNADFNQFIHQLVIPNPYAEGRFKFANTLGLNFEIQDPAVVGGPPTCLGINLDGISVIIQPASLVDAISVLFLQVDPNAGDANIDLFDLGGNYRDTVAVLPNGALRPAVGVQTNLNKQSRYFGARGNGWLFCRVVTSES